MSFLHLFRVLYFVVPLIIRPVFLSLAVSVWLSGFVCLYVGVLVDFLVVSCVSSLDSSLVVDVFCVCVKVDRWFRFPLVVYVMVVVVVV